MPASWAAETLAKESKPGCVSFGASVLVFAPSPNQDQLIVQLRATMDCEIANAACLLNDRITTGSKLYGRSAEVECLLKIRDSEITRSRLVVIQGATGAGKSALVNSVFQGCGMGKFDFMLQLQRPHSALLGAFSALVQHVVREAKNDVLRDLLESALVRAERIILLNMIPELKEILSRRQDEKTKDPRKVGCAYSTNECESRIKFAFCKFLECTRNALGDTQLVLVLDDVHWAGEADLDMVQSLLQSVRNLMVVVSVRNETPTLTAMLNNLTNSVCLNRMDLECLDETATSQLVAAVLDLEDEDTTSLSLAHIVFRHTTGNPYFILELLRALVEREVLWNDDSRWMWDLDGFRIEFGGTAADLIETKISRCSKQVLETLHFACCLGSRLDETILEQLVKGPVSKHLDIAAKIGLIVSVKEGEWSFAHDAVQEATFGLIPSDERSALHYSVGRKLWAFYDMTALDENIFVVVGQLVLGRELVLDDRERVAVAKLCLRAGERAIGMSSFQSSWQYLQHGIELLGKNAWVKEYDLALSLYTAAAEVGCCTGYSDEAISLVEVILKQGRSFNDTLRAHSAKIAALGSSNRVREAMAHGIATLKEMGHNFPTRHCAYWTFVELQMVRRRLRRKSSASLLRLPLVEDTRALAMMHILNFLCGYAYATQNELMCMFFIRMVTLTLDCGLCAPSSVAFSGLGMVLCGPLNDIDEGYRLGRVGMDILDKYQVRAWGARASIFYYFCVHTFKFPFQASLEPLTKVQQERKLCGDVENAGACGLLRATLNYEFVPLPETEVSLQKVREQVLFYDQKTMYLITCPIFEHVRILMGKGGSDPTTFAGEFNEQSLEKIRETNSLVYQIAHFHLALLAYMFGDLEKALRCIRVLGKALKQPIGGHDASHMVSLDSLLAVQAARTARCLWKQLRMRRRAVAQLRRIQHFARHSPETFLCKQFLLEAEIASISPRQHHHAHSLYVVAVASAKHSGSIFASAMANELAGKFHLRRGEEEKARPFLQESLEQYGHWGAKAKVDHLASEIHQYTAGMVRQSKTLS